MELEMEEELCQGCLSTDRKLNPIGKHEQLYQDLLLTKPNISETLLLFCWECHKIFDNIQKFRLRITKAQKLLNNRLLHYNSLSSLSSESKADKYTIVICDDVKEVTEKKLKVKDENTIYVDDKINNSNTIQIEVVVTPHDEFSEVKEEVKYEDDYMDGTYVDAIETEDKNEKKKYKSRVKSLKKKVVRSEDVPAKKEKRKLVFKERYRTVILKDIQDKKKLYNRVKIDEKTVKEWMEKKKKQTSKKKIQCPLCYCGFSQQKYYDHHVALKHAESVGAYICDICSVRFPEQQKLLYHIDLHFEQFVCKLCKEAFCTRGEIYLHYTHGPHSKMKECLECGLRFDCRQRKELYAHYRNMHAQFICDYCGRRCLKKTQLAKHIFAHHTVLRCNACDITFPNPDYLKRHNQKEHDIDPTEHNYCVECNVQFKNSYLYNYHLKNSIKHRPNPSIPCPECGKIYTKKINMTNHYALVHLKKTNHYCVPCDKYYLNAFRLGTHQKYFHEKLPKPKNKICKYCGKGFSENQILENHIRTHTGERPFACEQCSATFTQKHCLTAHVKSAHK